MCRLMSQKCGSSPPPPSASPSPAPAAATGSLLLSSFCCPLPQEAPLLLLLQQPKASTLPPAPARSSSPHLRARPHTLPFLLPHPPGYALLRVVPSPLLLPQRRPFAHALATPALPLPPLPLFPSVGPYLDPAEAFRSPPPTVAPPVSHPSPDLGALTAGSLPRAVQFNLGTWLANVILYPLLYPSSQPQ